jgi:tetratricopeptide (TPR) repeat protein
MFDSCRGKAWITLVVVASLLAAGMGAWQWRRHAARDSWRAQLRAAFVAKRYAEVETVARRLRAAGGLDDRLCELAAESALEDKRFADAIAWFDAVSAESPRWAACRARTGEIYLLSLHQLSPAEARLREALRHQPDHVLARQQLAGLLGMTGRTRAAGQQRTELLRQRRFTRTDLILMGLRETALENADSLKDYQRDAPADPLTQLALGHFEFRNHRWPTAEGHLRAALAANADLIEAHVLLGRTLWELRRLAELPAWRTGLPAAALDDADVWTLLGDWAREAGPPRGAIRCYLEALRRDPLQQRACYQVAQLLQAAGQESDAEPFRVRATRLQELLIAVKHFHAGQDHRSVQKIVTLCEQLGLLWEAWGWSLAARDAAPQLTWPAEALARLEPRLAPDLPRTLASANPAAGLDAAAFPLPDWSADKDEPLAPPSSRAAAAGTIAFHEAAESVGLEFTYFTGHDPSFGGKRVFEFSGGGVGVLDYDLDGWPDLYFPQGCRWPPQPGQREHLDRLFRNGGDGAPVRDVTEAAGLAEDRYSQGVAVGDWNDDGFPDLFVANVGPNRLYCNNGDGTFTDATEAAGVAGDAWTTSCLVADLNGDGFPDLYVVNYLAGSNLYERLCADSQGQPRICTPHDLDAAPDEFYLNLGDGRFAEQSAACGLTASTGKGLGVLAADFTGTGRLDLFVANDTDGNLFFRNAGAGGACRFDEQGVAAGLAFDHEGRSLACMGVAAGDANGDGLLDLFVTNYYGESNTLYVQQPGGVFLDQAREAGLHTPSLNLLGFGTQFLDADLDGRMDLVLVNGHVDDERAKGIPYQMRPQFFHNIGGGRFEERPAEHLGAWFARPTLGRGLARLDWNRDGRPDFVVSHLEHPAALLTNASSRSGASIAVRLHGTVGNRDALGAVVQIAAPGCTISQQLTGGDGYQASNERVLTFGLGECTHATRLIVRWPTGIIQTLERPQVGMEYRLIEGRAEPTTSRLSGF